jgi:hypothetical protein
MAFEHVAQPGTFAERCTLARRIRDELEVPLPIFVDGMDDMSRALFSDLPSPAFIIDRNGAILDKLPWADPEPLTTAIANALAQDPPLQTSKTAPWTVDQRDAFARRLLADGKHDEALAWLDAKPDPEPSVPPTLIAAAQTAITRALALRSAKEAERVVAIDAARAAITNAWKNDPARQTVARVELAEAAADTARAAEVWQEALAGLDAKTPTPTRVWIRQQLDRVAPKPR